jgi:hypothetical protein
MVSPWVKILECDGQQPSHSKGDYGFLVGFVAEPAGVAGCAVVGDGGGATFPREPAVSMGSMFLVETFIAGRATH